MMQIQGSNHVRTCVYTPQCCSINLVVIDMCGMYIVSFMMGFVTCLTSFIHSIYNCISHYKLCCIDYNGCFTNIFEATFFIKVPTIKVLYSVHFDYRSL